MPRPRVRTLVDPQTGDVVTAVETYRTKDGTYALGTSFTPVNDTLMLDMLHHESGFTSTDRDILALHLHGAHGKTSTGALRMTRQEIADYLKVTLRTVASSLARLAKAELLLEAERHGRIVYYKPSAHAGSREGGTKQRRAAAAQPRPSVPKATPEGKAS